ncbi:MAG: hypothetical protein Q7U68_01820 [Candidatus Roizmanbacteria bacterium]|nr:hypothetical protein [Candidatus Roizmanbacteria bacterium]
MKKIFAFLVVIFSFLAVTVSAFAGCGGQYESPCQSYSIIVDKMVGKPGISNDATVYEYVDNLGVSDPRFKPDQIVFFKIKIKNTSTTKLVGMEVKDTVPSYLEPVEGPGTLSSETRTITWNAGDFNVDEEKVFYLKMKILPQANLPADKGLLCIVNQVQADSANAHDDDTSQLCIEKQVVGAQKVPSAGPELGILLLSGQVALLGAGLYFRKKA